MMKLLVTGASGQLAQMLKRVAAQDLRIETLGRGQLDITDRASVASAFAAVQPDLVINTAAYTAVDKAENERDEAFRINADGAENIAREASRQGCPTIQISTDYIFDGHAQTAYSETDTPNPLNVYGASKLAGELAVRASNSEHLIIRTSWLYAPLGTNFVTTMLRLAETRETVSVVDDQIGCPTAAADLAAVLVDLSRQIGQTGSKTAWGTYHLAGSGTSSWAELARETFRLSGKYGGPGANVEPVTTEAYGALARRPLHSVLDCRKAEREFSLRLPDWRDSLDGCVAAITATMTRG